MWRSLSPLLLVAIPLTSSAGTPSDYEQYMLELINRARANPTAEVARIDGETGAQPGLFGGLFGFNSYDGWATGSSGLNEGPPNLSGQTYTIPSAAKQPLAFNSDLLDATTTYSGIMASNSSISHTLAPEPSSTQRMMNEGFSNSSPTNDSLDLGGGSFALPGDENNATVSFSQNWNWSGYAEDIQKEAVDLMHHNLFVDDSAATRGHRITMMAGDWKEIGISMNWQGVNSGGATVYANHNFAFDDSSDPFLTGVVYNDTDANGFYTPTDGGGNGYEGLGGIQITADDGAGGVYTTSTWDSGGYSLEVPPATYNVTFTQSGQVLDAGSIMVSGASVKLDAVNPLFIPEPSTTMLLALTMITAIGRRKRSSTLV